MQLITIEVTPDIASKIRFCAESGVFALQNGSATLHFKDGNLKSIKEERYCYAQTDEVAVNNTGAILQVSV